MGQEPRAKSWAEERGTGQSCFQLLKESPHCSPQRAPLMHIPADSEQEVALIPSICSVFICLVEDTDEEKFPGNTVEGIPGGGRTDLETYRAT